MSRKTGWTLLVQYNRNLRKRTWRDHLGRDWLSWVGRMATSKKMSNCGQWNFQIDNKESYTSLISLYKPNHSIIFIMNDNNSKVNIISNYLKSKTWYFPLGYKIVLIQRMFIEHRKYMREGQLCIWHWQYIIKLKENINLFTNVMRIVQNSQTY